MTFYEVKIGQASCVDYAAGNDWEQISCPADEGHRRAGKRLTPLVLKLVRNKTVDFSLTTLADIVISDRARQVLSHAGLTGFELKPVQLMPKTVVMGVEQPVLWEVVVKGDAGFSRPESGIVLRSECKACGLRRYSGYRNGILVDSGRWDGSDLFAIREYPKIVLCSDVARRAIVGSGLTNIVFDLAENKRWPDNVVEP